MILSEVQIRDYNEHGYLYIENVFNEIEVNHMLSEMHKVISENCPRRILEKNGFVRSFFSPEWNSELFSDVIKLERLVLPSKQLIGSEIYKHQTKLNTKHALLGDWWEWHQDYIFWKKEDGMREPQVITVMIYLNDVNEFNGPLLLIPGSHKQGIIDLLPNTPDENDNKEWFSEYHQSTDYMSSLTADLKYTLKDHTLVNMIEKNGIHSIKGPAGSVIFFHGNLFHASSNNLSPWHRHTFLITYNSIKNKLPDDMPNPRPDFISSRDFSAIESIRELNL
ncbi:phytanoyl-CoA dioxygenase family protein [Mucilaginibacter sp. RCC_168]|uniref:phytanoyl-CoA dioxygenase family protein n=1 Tax=Mucilaginibacter sp. RCC_168 TaxID=3239221 RepID=UPI0035255B64